MAARNRRAGGMVVGIDARSSTRRGGDDRRVRIPDGDLETDHFVQALLHCHLPQSHPGGLGRRRNQFQLRDAAQAPVNTFARREHWNLPAIR